MTYGNRTTMKERRKPQNWYDILQVTTEAAPEVIAAAFKTRSKKFHPDTSASEGFRLIETY